MREHKKLIAVLTNNDDDIYCFRKEVIEALIANGYDVLISCPYGEKFELMSDIPYIYDDPIIDRRGTNVIHDFRLFRHYRKLLKTYRPSAVLAYTAKPNVYGGLAAKSLGIPYISNITGFGSVLNKQGLVRAFIMWLFKLVYRGAACLMFQNATNRQLAIEQGMVKGENRLIPGSGVNTERFHLLSYPAGGDGVDGEAVVFNYIGRILRDKGVEDYIELARRVKAKYPQTEFNMLGFIEPTEAHYETDLQHLQDKGIIVYRGSQKDVRPFIERSHATIHPSTYGEGMSNVLLESAASGRVLITTDNPGCRETVNDEETGYIYAGGNVDQLFAAVEKFLAMPNEQRKAMGERGREKVCAEFSRTIVINAYLEELERILTKEDTSR
ncbi:MAG: glycosyltransferase family 4 protein [Clostridia bacterium]|nr:glycosyltransferase family 4 protein [Clostridia bacterium]